MCYSIWASFKDVVRCGDLTNDKVWMVRCKRSGPAKYVASKLGEWHGGLSFKKIFSCSILHQGDVIVIKFRRLWSNNINKRAGRVFLFVRKRM